MLASESKELYLSEFRRYRNNGATKNPAWLRQLRETAIASFQDLGFPTTHDEDWRYTNIDAITSVAFQHGNGVAKTMAAEDIFGLALADSQCQRLVFLNGRYCPELSSLRDLTADGAFVVVTKNCKLREPIHLIFVSIANTEPVASHPRSLFIVEHGGEAQIVETYIGLGTQSYF